MTKNRALPPARLNTFDPDATAWMDQAACSGIAEPGLFFPDSHLEAAWAPARQVCARCPVRYPCLDYAVAHRIDHGMWGGLTHLERRVIVRRQTGAAASG